MLIKFFKKRKQLTLAEKQQMTRDRLVKLITDLFDQMKCTYDDGQSFIKNNPYGLTPTEAIEGLGSDFPELLRLATLLKDCLNIAVPGTIEDDGEPY